MLSPTQWVSDAPNQGISSRNLYCSGSSQTRHLQGRKASGERPESLQRRADMLRLLSDKRARISNSSVSPGVLEFYGLQLHNLTPASILHIAGFVALCELFLGIEAHFALWKKLFCLVPHSQEGSIYQVGGAELWRIARTGYLSGPQRRCPRTGLQNGFI